MVFLSDIPSTFWGVTLDGSGKKYTQTVKHSFHISMAALEPSPGYKTDGKGEQFVSIMVQHDQAEFMICTLEHGRLYNQPLDLNFLEGEEVTFFLNGKGIVHMTGYLDEDLPEPDDEEDEESEDSDYEPPELLAIDEEEEDSESSEEEVAKAASGKRKKKAEKKQKKKQKRIETDSDEEDLMESEDDNEEEEESDEGNEFLDMEAIEDNEWMDDDDDEEDDDEDDEDEDENEVSFGGSFIEEKKEKSKGKKSKDSPTKKQDQTPSKQSPPVQNGDTSEKKKKKKKKKKKNKNKGEDSPTGTPQSQSKPNTPDSSQSSTQSPQTPASGKKQSPQTPASGKKQKVKKQVLEGGLLVEDVKDGHGPEAKPGKMVHVYYKGTLSKTGKVFDSNLSGKPFRFKLGKREVIQGWDSGLKGMKVGGKRRLTIPPKLGYGGQKAGDIPPNSTLTFDVELKAIS